MEETREIASIDNFIKGLSKYSSLIKILTDKGYKQTDVFVFSKHVVKDNENGDWTDYSVRVRMFSMFSMFSTMDIDYKRSKKYPNSCDYYIVQRTFNYDTFKEQLEEYE